MSIRERLAADMKEAMKARESERLTCIRMLRSKMQELEVQLRGKHGKEYVLTDEEAQSVVISYAKQRRDSIDGYRQGGREEMAAAEERELALVQGYLPQQLSEDEVREAVRVAIAEVGASSPRDMGAVMKLLTERTRGRADGKLLSTLVRGALAG
jgi:uncharacterized protein YqeY